MKINRHTRRKIKAVVRGSRPLVLKFMWGGNAETVYIYRRLKPAFATIASPFADKPSIELSAKSVFQAWEEGGSEKLLLFIDASLALVG